MTVPLAEESIAAVALSKNSGLFFKLHKGMHSTHDDVFKAEKLKERGAEVEELQKEKKN